MRSIERSKKVEKENSDIPKELFRNKEKANAKNIRSILLDNKVHRQTAKTDAIEIFKLVEKWMSESKKPYALGTDTYTLCDVFFTTMLTRCYWDSQFFTNEV